MADKLFFLMNKRSLWVFLRIAKLLSKPQTEKRELLKLQLIQT